MFAFIRPCTFLTRPRTLPTRTRTLTFYTYSYFFYTYSYSLTRTHSFLARTRTIFTIFFHTLQAFTRTRTLMYQYFFSILVLFLHVPYCTRILFIVGCDKRSSVDLSCLTRMTRKMFESDHCSTGIITCDKPYQCYGTVCNKS